MKKSLCGIDCEKCEMSKSCKGCVETMGAPFGGECVIATCNKNKTHQNCTKCDMGKCVLKNELINDFNELHIKDMEKVTELNALSGAFVNMEYTLENGQKVKLLDDNKIYLGNQLCKKNSDRCYGLATDGKYLLVCEYGNDGKDPEIIVYKKL